MRTGSLTFRNAIVYLVSALVLACFACTSPPEVKSARHMEAGKKLMAKNDPVRAALEFRNAVQATPKNADAYYQLGIALLTSGDLLQGVKALRAALELNPGHAGAQLRMAQLEALSIDQENWEAARGRLQALLQDGEDNPEALHTLALTELKLGEPQEAMQHLARAIAAAPAELVLAATLAQVKLQQKDPAGAETVLVQACQNSPKSADAVVLLGRFYGSQKRFAEAEQQFERALGMEADFGPALLSLASLYSGTGRKQEAEGILKRLSTRPEKQFRPAYGLFLFQEGRRDEAIREFERLAAQDPSDRATRTRLVVAYSATGRLADAEKLLAAALKKNSRDQEALLQQAELHLRAGKHAEAEQDLNRVLKLSPDSASAHYILARLHQARGETLSYRQQLSKVLSLNPYLLPVRLELAQLLAAPDTANASLNVLDEAPESQRNELPILIQRNWTLWVLGDMAELRKGIDQGLARQRSPELLIQDAMWKLRSGNPAAGRAALEEALRIDPSDLRALAILKDSYLAEKKNAVAVQKVKEYAAKQPKSAPVQHFLGTLLMASGSPEQAKAAFTAAKAADPQFVPADLSLVQMAVLDGKWDEAANMLQRVVESGDRNALARLWLGNVEFMKKNRAGALEQYRKVVEAEPDNPEALNNMAYLLAQDPTRLDEALKHAERARERAPENPEIADTLGWIYYRKGLYSLAVQHLELAAKSRNPVCQYHLAMAYIKLGDSKRGQAVLEAARKVNPKLPEAAEAEALLRQAN